MMECRDCDGTGKVHISSWEHCWTDGFGDWCSFNRAPNHSAKSNPEGWCFKYKEPLCQEKSGVSAGFVKRLHKCIGEHGLEHLREDEYNPTSIKCPTCDGTGDYS